MRTRLANRSARLLLAAAAATALAATTTACGPEDNGAAAPATSASTSTDASADASDGAESGTGGTDSGAEDSGSEAGTGADKDDGKGAGEGGVGQSCGTNDLDLTLTPKSQAGGYYQVTAKAKSGITCYLDVNTPSVSFGSKPEGVASPVGQGGEDPIKLSGSAVAYTGISPKTTKGDAGVEFGNVIVSVTDEDPNPADLALPEPAVVEKPIVTNWSTNPGETVPVIV
ncbi:hypothetical protein CLM85_07900 [Streptomyces albidoflavus]|uniref:hypothetical protein n=1 Tax=Streptomyces albidoflavus TaxID=1886 RepID=UPI000BAE124A|nr:hypothetical protein [Streptomyces albidoflavus]PAX82155.1 hypothetical protein CLM81_29440 [Streptomyces albidoflavus]PAX92482.1 hypothetical protein CLM82_03115 [Streptomyces albidoflavus]PBO17338.1 hypothetical protein CLM83_18725 [Streptomyces albidoflavus]PBO24830.1 hypothetical protein CLM85_07900 [Streptomyces albidoflavus]PBO27998.1 hypothetical protein CLM84_22535 [Streptomyces albidoflavus]